MDKTPQEGAETALQALYKSMHANVGSRNGRPGQNSLNKAKGQCHKKTEEPDGH